ncbi:MAG: ribulose-phosphate 3-epimerase [Lactobacillales bacterium]|jgi:ribulose-phosphate 3-epimerase|nr:ribulose-phosphate 3-epimerase [Lactobacillales bacterium]
MKIAPSILSADFANLERDIRLVEENGADYLHVDVMDGHFVPNITMGANVVQAIRPITKLPLDVHLMVEKPEQFIENFANAGADIISVHIEATAHIHALLQKIKNFNKKAGIVINPGTPINAIQPVLTLVDQVLIMTVNPGFGGQKFLPETLTKVTEIATIKKNNNYSFEIEVDGGINEHTIRLAKNAGANIFVAGSFIYNAADPAKKMKILRTSIEDKL